MIDADLVIIASWTVSVIGCYHFLDFLFPLLTKRFKDLKSGRRRYVIKNLLKSALLLFLGIIVTPSMYRLFYHSNPDNEWLHTIGMLYAIPDIYSLWWVWDSLYASTVYHHVSVGILATVGLFLDHRIETHWVAMIVYAYLSMWTGIVNFYLGARFLLKRDDGFEDKLRRNIAAFSLWVYMICCAANWLYQLHTVMLWIDFRWGELTWTNFVGLIAYCSMLVFIIKDDLILMRKLNKECFPYQPDATIEMQVAHFKTLLKNEIFDVQNKWPVTTKNTTITTSYPWPFCLNSVMDKVNDFRTPYNVNMQLADDNSNYVFTVENCAKSKE